MLLKILYEIQILLLLPEFYMPGISFCKDFDLLKLIIGWGVYFLFLLYLVSVISNTFIDYCLVIFTLLNLMPGLSSFGLNNTSWSYILFFILYWINTFFISNSIKKFKFKKKFVITLESPIRLYKLGLFLIGFLVIAFTYKYNKLKISFNLADVYDVRNSAAGNLPIWFSWIKNSFGNVCCSFLLIFSYSRKKYFECLLILFIQLLLFSIGMDKTYILLILISTFFCFNDMTKRKKCNICLFIVLGLCLVMILSFIEKYLIGTTFLFYIVIRRTFYIPVFMSQMFYSFFSNNSPLYFSQGVFIISKMIPSIYNESYLDLINYTYFNGLIPSPNAGLFAEAYMHFGSLGCFILPFFVAVNLAIISRLTTFITEKQKMVCAICFSIILCNLPVTSGMFFSIMFFALPIFLLTNYISQNSYIENYDLFKYFKGREFK